MTYVAFLRGINLGGRTIKMEALKHAFGSLDFQNVKTLLASGNVIFETEKINKKEIVQMIEEKLEKQFGFSVGTIIWTIEDINNLIESDPFKEVKVTPDTRLYVTFLSEEPRSTLAIPYASEDDNFKILTIINNAICSVLTLSPSRKTVDLMGILEKEFGKKVTTRNWNTVTRIVKQI